MAQHVAILYVCVSVCDVSESRYHLGESQQILRLTELTGLPNYITVFVQGVRAGKSVVHAETME